MYLFSTQLAVTVQLPTVGFMNRELGRVSEEGIVGYWVYFLRICLQALRKTTKTCQDSLYSDRDYNLAPNHTSQVLPLVQRGRLKIVLKH